MGQFISKCCLLMSLVQHCMQLVSSTWMQEGINTAEYTGFLYLTFQPQLRGTKISVLEVYIIYKRPYFFCWSKGHRHWTKSYFTNYQKSTLPLTKITKKPTALFFIAKLLRVQPGRALKIRGSLQTLGDTPGAKILIVFHFIAVILIGIED